MAYESLKRKVGEINQAAHFLHRKSGMFDNLPSTIYRKVIFLPNEFVFISLINGNEYFETIEQLEAQVDKLLERIKRFGV